MGLKRGLGGQRRFKFMKVVIQGLGWGRMHQSDDETSKLIVEVLLANFNEV